MYEISLKISANAAAGIRTVGQVRAELEKLDKTWAQLSRTAGVWSRKADSIFGNRFLPPVIQPAEFSKAAEKAARLTRQMYDRVAKEAASFGNKFLPSIIQPLQFAKHAASVETRSREMYQKLSAEAAAFGSKFLSVIQPAEFASRATAIELRGLEMYRRLGAEAAAFGSKFLSVIQPAEFASRATAIELRGLEMYRRLGAEAAAFGSKFLSVIQPAEFASRATAIELRGLEMYRRLGAEAAAFGSKFLSVIQPAEFAARARAVSAKSRESYRQLGADAARFGNLFLPPVIQPGELDKAATKIIGSFGKIGSHKDKLRTNFKGLGKDVEDSSKRSARAWEQFSGSFVRAGRNAMREFEQTFLGRGFFNLTRQIFAPLGGVARGFREFQQAGLLAAGMLRNPSFVQATNIFRVLGHVLRGAGDAMGGLIAQAGRLASFPLRALGGILSAFGGSGRLLGGVLGGVGRVTGFLLSDVAGELVSVAGKVLGGLADITAAALKPIAGIFDTLISPVTMVFRTIQFAWQFSLIAMTGATIAFVKKSITEFSQFERNLSRTMIRLSGAGAFGQFGKMAREISREVGVSVDQTAKAIEKVTAAGFKNAQDVERVATVGAKLATASMSDVGTATEAITNLLEGFGLGADSAVRAGDALFTAMQQGTLDMNDLAQGIEKLSPLFHQTGSSMEDMLATTALLSRSAQGEMTVFTELSQIVQRLVAPSRAATQAMGAMGITITRNQQGGSDWLKTITTIGSRLRQLSGGDPLRMSRLLGGIVPGGQGGRSQRAALRLFGMSPEDIESTLKAFATSGSVQKGMRAIADKMWRQGDILGATWERLKIAVGEGLKPMWQSLIGGAERFFGAIERAASGGRFDRLGASLRKLFLGDTTWADSGFTDGVIKFFETTLPAAIESVTPKFREFVQAVRGFFTNVVPGMDFDTMFVAMRGEFIELREMAKEVWGDVFEWAKNEGIAKMTEFGEWLGQQTWKFVINPVINWDASPATQIKSPFVRGQQSDPVSRALGIPDIATEDTADFYKNWWDIITRSGTSRMGLRNYPGETHARGGIVSGAPSRTDNRIIKVRSGEEIITPEDPRHIKNLRGFAQGGVHGAAGIPGGAGTSGFGGLVDPAVFKAIAFGYDKTLFKQQEQIKRLDGLTIKSEKTVRHTEEAKDLLRKIYDELRKGRAPAQLLIRLSAAVGAATGAAAPGGPGAPPLGLGGGGFGGGGFGPMGPPARPGGPRDRRGRPISPREQDLGNRRKAHEDEMQRRRDQFGADRWRVPGAGIGGGADVVPPPRGDSDAAQDARRAKRKREEFFRKNEIVPSPLGMIGGVFPKGAAGPSADDKARERAMRDAGRQGIHPGMAVRPKGEPGTGYAVRPDGTVVPMKPRGESIRGPYGKGAATISGKEGKMEFSRQWNGDAWESGGTVRGKRWRPFWPGPRGKWKGILDPRTGKPFVPRERGRDGIFPAPDASGMDDRSRARPAPDGTAPFNRQSSTSSGSDALGLASEINAMAGGGGLAGVLVNITRQLEQAKSKMQAVQDDVATLKSGVA